MKKLSERYKTDLGRLVQEGKRIAVALQYECDPKNAKTTGLKQEDLRNPRNAYQGWYSEALACVRQLLPDRVDDFISYYKPQKPRKDFDWQTYTMSDYMIGATVRARGSFIIPISSALSAVHNQCLMLEGILSRFESTLFAFVHWFTRTY